MSGEFHQEPGSQGEDCAEELNRFGQAPEAGHVWESGGGEAVDASNESDASQCVDAETEDAAAEAGTATLPKGARIKRYPAQRSSRIACRLGEKRSRRLDFEFSGLLDCLHLGGKASSSKFLPKMRHLKVETAYVFEQGRQRPRNRDRNECGRARRRNARMNSSSNAGGISRHRLLP